MMQCQCGSILIMVGYQSICFSNPVLTFCIRAKPRMHVGGSVPPPLKVAYTRLSSCKINRYSQPFTTWVLIKFSLLLCYVAGGKKSQWYISIAPVSTHTYRFMLFVTLICQIFLICCLRHLFIVKLQAAVSKVRVSELAVSAVLAYQWVFTS